MGEALEVNVAGVVGFAKPGDGHFKKNHWHGANRRTSRVIPPVAAKAVWTKRDKAVSWLAVSWLAVGGWRLSLCRGRTNRPSLPPLFFFRCRSFAGIQTPLARPRLGPKTCGAAACELVHFLRLTMSLLPGSGRAAAAAPACRHHCLAPVPACCRPRTWHALIGAVAVLCRCAVPVCCDWVLCPRLVDHARGNALFFCKCDRPAA